jgi:hypothetical protein
MTDRPEAIILIPGDIEPEEVKSIAAQTRARFPGWSVAFLQLDGVKIFQLTPTGDYTETHELKPSVVLNGQDVIDYIERLIALP